ncbi:alkanesulfonate monooxygenase SsuD/methylene tetrahydromethanopterin reductase-like flavin-dependent oxidoreductase (luciferase family) [Glaciihabitans tibetensis]|uniref:Alkanesulfonate monooxygenase SsuD/methylene tetrahydromethanopterin reductase-like flavin-dependent oxidoreductase (Luciferase family) n=1 Tax=Glaciihabitans tibetensis TaxID=1266600 RepID=A0A2T0V1L2_9MICO|nr:LLM class flavin-dependent oxidoreductase [Glaciihabitans tibetensis]PRY64069.1 alkanesulfonate monooxygenase SsuD/methylene tetrahydromethanopterin reductase-like flavin-dependent oxidoreductase (luciferase family) [Glaciihabitans tibetensis]
MTRSPLVGVLLPRDIPIHHLVPYAQKAEALGFDELWVVEDCFFRGGIAQAAAVLASTTRIVVGIGILPAGARNPVFTSLEVATLAELYPGRIVLGIGHGMPVWMKQVGAAVASPLTVLAEQLATIRAILRGENVSVDGRYVKLDGVELEAAPRIAPPVLAGVRGPKSLAVSGEHADGTILAEPVTPEYITAALAHISVGVERATATQVHQPAPVHQVVAYNVAAIDDDPDVARALARPALEWIGESDWTPHIAPLAFAAELAALRERSASRQDFVSAMPDEWVDQLALVGTPDRVRARIAELGAAGATSVVLTPADPDPMAALDSFARIL